MGIEGPQCTAFPRGTRCRSALGDLTMPVRSRPLLYLFALLVFGSQVGWRCGGGVVFSSVINNPHHGTFTTASSVAVNGLITNKDMANVKLFVNGVVTPVNPNGTWSTTIALDPAKVFNPIYVLVRDLATGELRTSRVVVIAGPSVADGDYSLNGIALRLNDTGLDSVEPLVSSLVDLDIAALLPPGTQVISGYCAIDSIFGCLGRVDVVIASPAPTFSSFDLQMDSMTNFVAGDVIIHNIEVHANINGSGLAPSCGIKLTASQLDILGDYSLEPDASDPTIIDVNLTNSPGVVFTGFNNQFTSGLCDFPLIGDLIQLIIGDIQPAVTNGLVAFLADPDGSGPADAPIAEGIETALQGIQIAGPIGQGLGVLLDAPLFAVDEDSAGLTLGSDARMQAQFGTGVGECQPPPDAPDLTASLDVAQTFPTFGATTPSSGTLASDPTFGATTPVSGLPYGLGIAISASAFNQLLKAQIECGLLQVDITELDLLGTGTPQPVTAGLLSLLVPELASADPNLPLTIQIRPTLAPVLTGNTGPNGELAELRVGGLNVTLYEPVHDQDYVSAQVDFAAGLEFAFDDQTGELVPTLGSVSAPDIEVGITDNLIMTDPGTLAFLLEALLPGILPSISDTLGAFPLPDFLGLSLQSVAVERNGDFISLFTDLVQSP